MLKYSPQTLSQCFAYQFTSKHIHIYQFIGHWALGIGHGALGIGYGGE
ncbi:MAG: hypothetical protein V7K61_32150 [Nostoc sp.]